MMFPSDTYWRITAVRVVDGALKQGQSQYDSAAAADLAFRILCDAPDMVMVSISWGVHPVYPVDWRIV